MSVKYEDLQYLESEKKSQRFTEALFSSQTFLKRLLSSPCLLLLSLALSLLLASICVMGYQNFKFQSDLQTLRTSFSNFTSNSMAEVQALNSQGRSFQEMITSLKAEVESHKQELQAGDSEMLLRVQQLVKNLNSLTCKMDALKSNGKSCSQNTACCPANWLEHEGHCYWFSSLRKPWPEAEKDCQLKNAQLVVINSRDEQDFIQANLHPYFTWMGLSDPDGVWKWVDGSDYETNIKNWKPGQPDDFHGHGLGGGEDCAHFYPDGEWNDDACQRLYYWICEAGLSQGNES
uniref:C-type lectin domain containing 10A n=1 Tax=Bos taurus TaxID=9913 RepID=E1BJL5_BOVIN